MGAEASATLKEFISHARNRQDTTPASFSNMLAAVATDLLRCQEYASAEALLRESLTIRELHFPDAWTTYQTQAMVGGTLLKQKKYVAAEPMLLKGYEGMKTREAKIPAAGKGNISDSLKRLVDLYTAWDKPAEAAKWQAELDAAQAAQPGKQP